MLARIAWLSLTVLVFGFVASARAGDPVGETLPIDLIVVPDQPIHIERPNIFDPFHPKQLWFKGEGMSPDGGVLDGFFDWIGLNGEHLTSHPFQVDFEPGVVQAFEQHFEIPFCPPLVSLDLRVAEAPVHIRGMFSHECLVPEPGTLALAGVGALSLGLVAYGRRRRTV